MGKIQRTIDITGRLSTGKQYVTVQAYDNELEKYSTESNTITFDAGGLIYGTGSDGNLVCVGLDPAFEGTKIVIDREVKGVTVTEIAANAFDRIAGITEVTIPDTVKIIGKYAFDNCTNLETVNLGQGVTTIGNNAFSNCAQLTKITIPASARTLGSNAFANCAKLEQVYINKGLETIGSNAFNWCSSLESITIPDSVTRIEGNTFGKTAITTINIPDSVTYIGNAFSRCDNLCVVTLGNGISHIGQYMFQDCTALTTVNIPDSVESIADAAFYNCSALESITIPESVKEISFNAFKGCTNLATITFNKPHGWFYTDIAVPTQIREGENCTHVPASAFRPLLLTQNYANYIWFRISEMPAPEISVDDGMLSITDYSGMADKFKIYVNDDVFEISTGKTRTISAGTYLANETLVLQPGGIHELNFVCDGVSCSRMFVSSVDVTYDEPLGLVYSTALLGGSTHYWGFEKYRTITISEDVSVTEDCYNFFTANFTEITA